MGIQLHSNFYAALGRGVIRGFLALEKAYAARDPEMGSQVGMMWAITFTYKYRRA